MVLFHQFPAERAAVAATVGKHGTADYILCQPRRDRHVCGLPSAQKALN
jgi:hypothetical protein